jgi:ribokinase
MNCSNGWDVVVIGGANWDFLARGPKLPKAGETVPGDEFQEAPGGKGANQAVAAARLGARVAFVGRVGVDQRGEQVLSRLADEGVHAQYVTRDSMQPTGSAIVMVDWSGEKQILTAPGANRWLTPLEVEQAAPAIQSARLLLIQLEIPIDSVHRALQLAHVSGTLVVLDPAPPQALSDDLLSLVGTIRANAGEAELLTGIPVHDRASARRAADELIKRGVKQAVLQAGPDGNLAVSNGDEFWLPRVHVPAVDSTGAGDAFAAALAVMIGEGKSLQEASRFANAAAALKTTVLGAQAGLPRRDTVRAMLHFGETWHRNSGDDRELPEIPAIDRLMAHAPE